MTAPRRSVRQPQHRVKMNDRLASVLRDITQAREHLCLFGDDDALVLAPSTIEEAENGRGHGSYGRDRAGSQGATLGEAPEEANGIFANLER